MITLVTALPGPFVLIMLLALAGTIAIILRDWVHLQDQRMNRLLYLAEQDAKDIARMRDELYGPRFPADE